jgi:hypothetical protein
VGWSSGSHAIADTRVLASVAMLLAIPTICLFECVLGNNVGVVVRCVLCDFLGQFFVGVGSLGLSGVLEELLAGFLGE